MTSPERVWNDGDRPGDAGLRLAAVRVLRADGGLLTSSLAGDDVVVEIEVDRVSDGAEIALGFDLEREDGTVVMSSFLPLAVDLPVGYSRLRADIPTGLLNTGRFSVGPRGARSRVRPDLPRSRQRPVRGRLGRHSAAFRSPPSGCGGAAALVVEGGRRGVRVRLHASWCDDATIREAFNRSSPGGDYRWKELELTLDDEYDWYVVFNHPMHDDFDRSRTVIFQSEPRITRQRLAYEFGSRMAGCRLVDTDSHFNLDKWYVDRTYQQLLEPIEKTKLLSAVVSSSSWLDRHRQRLDFALHVLPDAGPVDHFGRDLPPGPSVQGELHDKADGLLPYRYTFNAENSLEPNYFTEKVLDAILCECLCFYDGCPNLEAFLDPETFVRVSMDDPEEAVAIMRRAIANGEWERRLPAIREQKRRLMEELNPLEIIRKVRRASPSSGEVTPSSTPGRRSRIRANSRRCT